MNELLDILNETDPKVGTGKKPKGSGRRLYTDENPKDTVSIKFKTTQDIKDTLSKSSFKSKPHARKSQIINVIHQRVRAAYSKAKDPDVKSRLKRALDYIEKRREASKAKTQRLNKMKENIDPSEAYSNVGSVQTLVNGKRKVAMIALRGQSDAAETIKIINDNGLKKIGIDQRPGAEVYVVYVPGAEADAKEFTNIINRYGGYASSKASYEDTKRMGELLGYKKSTIDAFLVKNYNDDKSLKENITEMNWKQALAGAGITLMSLGTPKTGQAQNFQGLKDKVKQGVSFVQSKIQKKQDEPKTVMIPGKRTQDRDLEKIRKEWSGYNSDSTTSKAFGEAVGQTESAARMAARANARTQIFKKMKTDQASFGSFIVDEAMWQLPNGNYQAMVVMDKN
jgi:hypothetical protein